MNTTKYTRDTWTLPKKKDSRRNLTLLKKRHEKQDAVWGSAVHLTL